MDSKNVREFKITDAPIPEVMRPKRSVTTAAIFAITDEQNNRTIDFESSGMATLHDEFRNEIHSIDFTIMRNFNDLCKLIRGEKTFGTGLKETLCRRKDY